MSQKTYHQHDKSEIREHKNNHRDYDFYSSPLGDKQNSREWRRLRNFIYRIEESQDIDMYDDDWEY